MQGSEYRKGNIRFQRSALVINAVMCLECGKVLISTSTHDFQSCNCPNETFIDGGFDYQRVGGMNLDRIEILSVEDLRWLLNIDQESNYLMVNHRRDL